VFFSKSSPSETINERFLFQNLRTKKNIFRCEQEKKSLKFLSGKMLRKEKCKKMLNSRAIIDQLEFQVREREKN